MVNNNNRFTLLTYMEQIRLNILHSKTCSQKYFCLYVSMLILNGKS